MFESQNVFSFASFEKKILTHFPLFEFLSSTHRFIPVERWSRLVVAAYHRFQPVPSTWPLPPVSSFFFSFFLPVLSFRNHQRSLPLSSEPADDRLTFGLMALAGSRRWWMTLGERETFGAIRRFKRFFVTGARYVAAPAWPATMRQKQCWLIAFQNCERWKTVPGHRWWRARFWERRPLFHVFFRDSKGVGEGRGFEERSRIRGTKQDSRKSSNGAIKSSGRDRCSRSASRRTFIDRTMTHSSFRLDDSSTFLEEFISFRISHCILSVEFVIYFSFFLLFSFFSRGVWDVENANFSFFFFSSGRKNQSVE